MTPGDCWLPQVSTALLAGIRLCELRDALGRTPSIYEIRDEFRCSRATAFRYRAALIGKRSDGAPPSLNDMASMALGSTAPCHHGPGFLPLDRAAFRALQASNGPQLRISA